MSYNKYCLCPLPQRAVVSISREAEANITRILHDVRRESQTDGPSGSSWQQSHQPSIPSSTAPSLQWGSESSYGGCGLTAGQGATCSMTSSTSHLPPGPSLLPPGPSHLPPGPSHLPPGPSHLPPGPSLLPPGPSLLASGDMEAARRLGQVHCVTVKDMFCFTFRYRHNCTVQHNRHDYRMTKQCIHLHVYI